MPGLPIFSGDRVGRGTTREFYQIGISANKTGISVYIMGINDKTYIAKTYGKGLGKASVTGYCIKFKTLKDITLDILQAAIRFGFEAQPGCAVGKPLANDG